MCIYVELTVRLSDSAATDSLALPDQSAYRLPNKEGTLWCAGEFPNYYITNGSCGCGSIDGPREGPGRLIPRRFVSYFLSIFPVRSVELLWWDSSYTHKPSAPARCQVEWSEFMHINDELRLESGVLYEIAGRPSREFLA